MHTPVMLALRKHRKEKSQFSSQPMIFNKSQTHLGYATRPRLKSKMKEIEEYQRRRKEKENKAGKYVYNLIGKYANN